MRNGEKKKARKTRGARLIGGPNRTRTQADGASKTKCGFTTSTHFKQNDSGQPLSYIGVIPRWALQLLD